MKSISISAKAIFSATLFSVGLFISAKASALPAHLFF